uniref:phenylalanine--tRNA ligase n=1 Tax=Astrosyne radiata TaxID=1158023 RepID=A0A2U9NTI7_9STRA|nr:phenylalanine-tRNA ligase beta subunit [Astrosyne radiata]AWT40345.1 phenylalanine-tRNA ligase beta subunit [Astrosyne radiata]
MLIALEWINESIDIKFLNLEYLINKLTIGGFEVENIIRKYNLSKKIIILDIFSTANRADTLSINGMSKEFSNLLNKPYKKSNYLKQSFKWENKFKKWIISSSKEYDCSAFFIVMLEDLIKHDTPNWLKQKLLSSGYIPKNNLLDYKHYIFLETGYPFEFYDLEKIYSYLNSSNFQIRFEKIKNNKIVINNDTFLYKLQVPFVKGNINCLPISIIGTLNNEKFCCTSKTKSILLEGSVFSPTFIYQQSRLSKLKTDRSIKYQKKIENDKLISSFYKLIKLLKVFNPDLKCKLHTISDILINSNDQITLNYNYIIHILGPIKRAYKNIKKNIDPILISNYLTQLKLPFTYNRLNLTWNISIPSFRKNDIFYPIDVIEEIARLYSYNKFLTRVPTIEKIGKKDKSFEIKKKVVLSYINFGFTELIHYSLENKNNSYQFPFHHIIRLRNPLTFEYSNLRVSLIPNLLKTVKNNLRYNNSMLQGFEFGHIFHMSSFANFQEFEYNSGIFGGIKNRTIWSNHSKFLSWFEAKGKIEQIFNQLNIKTTWNTSVCLKYEKIFHPYRIVNIYSYDRNHLGTFGQIHPILAKKLKILKPLFIFEFNFNKIKIEIEKQKLVKYKDYIFYPIINKNLSFEINHNVRFLDLKNLLVTNGTKFLKKIILLDEYENISMSTNKQSICIRLIFQSNTQTLQNNNVDNIVNNLKNQLIKVYNVSFKG